MRYLMGIDNGGTFSKAAIFDEYGQQISVSSLPTEVITPKPGYTERNLDDLWRINAQVIKAAIEKSGIMPNEIAGVSFSGHGKGLYLIGKDGQPCYNGILSTDARAWEYIEKWHLDGTSERVFGKTFQKILACQPVSLLAWLRDHEPDVYSAVMHVFSVKDYIRYKLTGEAHAEFTDFSGSNLVNLLTLEYDKDLLACFGLEDIYDKLPPLHYSADVCGYVTEAASQLTMLPAGIPVAAGMFDIDACAIASGLTDETQMCMVAGTWSINEYIAKAPITNGTVDLNSMFCMPEYFLIEESSPTSAGNLEWFVKNLLSYEMSEAQNSNKSIYKIVDSWVDAIEPQDCNVVFLPFLNGSNEDALAKASFIGLTAYHNKKHILRAVFEGVVFSHYTHVMKLLKNRDVPKSIRLSGGAANSEVWTQMFADLLQIPIDVIEAKEIGAQGAALAAGIAAGIYSDYQQAVSSIVRISKTIYPRPEYASIYMEKYSTYRAVIDQLSPVWKRFKN